MNSRAYKSFFEEIQSSIEFHQEAAKLDFALELKRAMDREGITPAQLAERLEVSRPMVSKLLRGDTNLTIDTMVKACRKVGGNLFVKIVRDGCSVRLFELAQAERVRAADQRAARVSPSLQRSPWKLAANDFGNVSLGYEEKPLAA